MLFPVFGFAGAAALFSLPALAVEDTLTFSGYTWRRKSGEKVGPGPNRWEAANVWKDKKGFLHLRISHKDGQWACAEANTTERLGFGTYEFQLSGRIDTLDKSIVVGLFNYPPADVGGDATNEIDIEFARWGNAAYPNGNFTVWPAKSGLKSVSHTFPFTLTGDDSLHRFTWAADHILFQSWRGTKPDGKKLLAEWDFRPEKPEETLPQKPMPFFFNLWLFQGHAPENDKEVEIVVKRFRFRPANLPQPLP